MTGRVAKIVRHPIKGHGRESLAAVALTAGRALPFDRHWAVAHEEAKLDPDGGWSPCQNFARGAKAPSLMAVEARLDEATRRITLTHPERPAFSFCPDDPGDLPAFLAWVLPLNPADRALPARVVTAASPFTDTDYPSVSLISAASNRALSQRMGRELSMHRWRGNLWLDGLAPWEEFDLRGREIEIGTARLRVEERITRCRATTANPETGRIDADTLAALEAGYGHRDFGVYATVVRSGEIAAGDRVTIL